MDLENLKKRINNLESEIASIKNELRRFEGHSELPVQKKESPKPTSAPSVEIPKQKAPRPELEFLLGGNLLGKAGLFAILLASLWFIKYAFDNRWVNESGRILIGLTVGFGVSFSGLFLAKKKFKILPESVFGTGISIVYLSIFGAYYFYDLFGLSETFVYLSLISVLSSLLAFRIRKEILYLFGLLGSLLSPVLISQGENSYRFLFLYLLFLNCIFFAIGSKLRWRISPFLLLLSNFAFFQLWFLEYGTFSSFGVPFLFLTGSFLLFQVRDLILGSGTGPESEKSDGTLLPELSSIFKNLFSVLNAAMFGYCGYEEVSAFYPDLTPHFFLFGSVLYAGILILSGTEKFGSKDSKEDQDIFEIVSVYAYLGFLFASLTDFSEGNWLTFSWILLAGSVSILGIKLRKNYLFVSSLLFWFVGLLKLYLFSERREGALFLLNEFFGLYALATLLLCSIYYLQRGRSGSDKMRIFVYLGIFTFILGSLLEIRYLIPNPHYRNLGYSYVLAFYAAIFLFVGFRYSVRSIRITGIVILSALVLKLYLYDIWTMSLLVRIIAGFSLGVGLVLISMFYQKFKEKVFSSKNTNLFFLLVFAGGMLSGFESIHAEKINTKGYRYYKEIPISSELKASIQKDEANELYGRIELDEDIVRHSGVRDRRLVWNGKSIPFFSTVSEEKSSKTGEAKTKLIFHKESDGKQIYVLKLPAPPAKTGYSSLYAKGTGVYEVSGNISVSDTPDNWPEGSDFSIYTYSDTDLPNPSNEIAFFADHSVYLRLETYSDSELQFPKAIYTPISERAEFKKTILAPELRKVSDSDSESTIYYYSNPMKVPIHRIELFFADKRFDRRLKISYKDDSKKFEELVSLDITRRKDSEEYSKIKFPQSVADELRIAIRDGDDEPLSLEKMEVYILKEEIKFPIPKGVDWEGENSFRIYYGNPYAFYPDFDFSRILAENSRILTWKIEQEKENENFGYSLMEPPVSVWIIRILYFIGLAISIYFAYRVFRRYASEIQTKESQPIESK